MSATGEDSVVASGKDVTLGLSPSLTVYPCDLGKFSNLLVPQFPHLFHRLIAASIWWSYVKVYRIKGVLKGRRNYCHHHVLFLKWLGPGCHSPGTSSEVHIAVWRRGLPKQLPCSQ